MYILKCYRWRKDIEVKCPIEALWKSLVIFKAFHLLEIKVVDQKHLKEQISTPLAASSSLNKLPHGATDL